MWTDMLKPIVVFRTFAKKAYINAKEAAKRHSTKNEKHKVRSSALIY
jgi:hypothetical protein